MKTNEKDTQQGVVPALRFPEFHGNKGWDLKPLSDYLTEYRQKSDGKSNVHSVSLSKGIVNQIEYLGRSFSADDTSHYKLVKPYDVVYTKSPTGDFPYGIVKQNFNPYNVIVSPLYGVFTPNNKYIGYIIHSIFESAIRLNNYLSTLIQKGAKNTIQISNNTFISKEILLPDNETEQQKIADCLSSIDALIKAAENKIDELKAHKKGLMQQLFPAEGKTVPALRFPEFQNAGEWSNSLLGKYIEEFQKKSFVQNEFEVLTSSREGLIRQREYYNNDRITERDNIGFNIIPPSYLTYRSRSDDRKFYFNENNLGITGIISTYYPVFRIIDGYGKFFIELFSYYAEIIGKYSDGTSQTVLSLNRLKSIKLPIPTKSEQQKIADCLSSVDDLITAQTNRLEALKAHKKGLMQQLFPNVNNNGESI